MDEQPIILSCDGCPVGPGARCGDCLVFWLAPPAIRLDILADASKAMQQSNVREDVGNWISGPML